MSWDNKVVDDETLQATMTDLEALSGAVSASPGQHTIGVEIVSQTSSPNVCAIYGLVTSPTGGANGGSQSITIPSANHSLATGVVTTITVSVR